MNISELSLRRPVLATVMSIVIIIFGVVGYTFLGVREYPAIDPPIISVRTTYTGANADIIESQITEPLEKSINGIQGVRTISSSSSIGQSNITVEFNLGVDLDNAANDVRDKVSQAQRNLPQDLDAPPVVSKSDASSEFIIILAVQSNTMGLLELSDYAETVLAEQLQTIPDVSGINVFGSKKYAMRIWIDPEKLNAYNLTFQDIHAALENENIELPSGKLYGDKTEITVRTLGRLTTEKDFADLIIQENENGIIRLSDIAKVELGPEELEKVYRLNGAYSIGLAIIPQPGSNYVAIADEFYKRLEEIKKTAEEKGVVLTVTFDTSKNVKKAISEVEETLLLAIGLVILVIFLFFRSWSLALRPLIDIPISLIGTFFIMYLAGFSVNVLTLLGIVLATGLVVDDGIVVTENIFRKLEKGMPIKKAALEGSKEIFFAVISTSITLAVVFMPIIFLEGFTGSLFREFGVVVAGAVLISAFVSLTITPVLNVYLNRKNTHDGWFYKKTEPFFIGMENGYKNLLTRFVKIKWASIAIIAICLVLIFFTYNNIQSELAPIEDRSNIRFSVTTPEGTSFEATSDFALQLENFLNDSIPEKRDVFAAIPSFAGTGVNSGFVRIMLVEPDERERSQKEILNYVNSNLRNLNDGRIFGIEEQTISVGIGSRGALPVQFVIQNLDFNQLVTTIPKFLAAVRKDPTFIQSDVNLKFNKPEVQVEIDRLKAKDLGLSVEDVAATLQLANSGRRAGYFTMHSRQYQVIAQVERSDRDDPADFEKIYVRNNRNELIPLSSVINIKESSSPPALFHYERYRSATVSAALAPGKTIGDGIEAMEAIADTTLEASFKTSLSGPSRDFVESSSNTFFALILALVLIYLVLAAQFESFKDPLIIMLTVPMAFAGALLSLYIFGQTLNIFSEIGIIMLIGLVTKNGILIVEFANKKRLEGSDKTTAAIEAATQRLRPILMTSLATSLGALPIALSLGAAATSRIPLGIVIVGGIIFSLLLTLLVIPGMYILLSGKKNNDSDFDKTIYDTDAVQE